MTNGRARGSARPAGIGTDELRRTEEVLAAVERSTSLADMLTVTLAALEEHFGYAGAFMLALSERTSPGRRAYAGTVCGFAEYILEEYFEQWADRDALGSEAARASFAPNGKATIAGVYRDLDPPRQLFVEEFLRRVRQTGQLSHRLACGWSDGYLTLMRDEEFSETDERIMGRLVPPLPRSSAPAYPAASTAASRRGRLRWRSSWRWASRTARSRASSTCRWTPSRST